MPRADGCQLNHSRSMNTMTRSLFIVLLSCAYLAHATVQVTSVSPATAPATGGTVFKVTGSGFAAETDLQCQVQVIATSSMAMLVVVVVSDTELTCMMSNINNQFTNGKVYSVAKLSVVVNSATAVGSLDMQIYVPSSLQITAVSTMHGATTANTPITFTGSGFFQTNDVSCLVQYASGTQVIAATVDDSTHISCVIPAVAVSAVSQVSQVVPVVPAMAFTTNEAIPIFQAQTFTYKMPAPILQSVVLSASGDSIALQWDFSLSPAPSSCASIFTAATMTLLGNNAVCSWPQPTQLVISLKQDATVTIGSTLAILDGTFTRASASYSYVITGQSMAVSSALPASAYYPVVSVVGPTKFVRCASTSVNLLTSVLQGLGYKPMTFQWTVTVFNSNNVDVTNSASGAVELSVASQASASSLTVAGDKFQSAFKYRFTLSVTNAFSFNIQIQHTVDVSPDLQTPIVVFPLGLTMQTYRSQPTLIDYSISFSPCFMGPVPTTQASWTFTPVTVGAPAVSINTSPSVPQLLIPAGTLQAGASYTATVTVTIPSLPSVLGTGSITVNVGTSDIIPRIVGGDRTFVASETVVLAASSSIDPDTASSTGSTYAWSCFSYAQVWGSSTVDCTSLISDVTLASISVQPPVNKAFYVFTVAVTKGSRTSSTSTTLISSQAGTSATMLPLHSLDAHVATDEVVLRALVTARVGITSVRWEVAATDDTGSVLSTVQLSSVAQSELTYSVVATANLLNSNMAGPDLYPETPYQIVQDVASEIPLVLAANALTPNKKYRFKLIASQGSTDVSYAQWDVTPVPSVSSTSNAPLAVSPATGTGLTTLFSLTASGFTADPAASPLTYSFYFKDSSSKRFDLAAGLSPQLASFVLPASAIKVGVAVIDSLGNIQTQEIAVSVSAPSSLASTYLNDALVNAQTQASLSGFLSSLPSLVSTLVHLSANPADLTDVVYLSNVVTFISSALPNLHVSNAAQVAALEVTLRLVGSLYPASRTDAVNAAVDKFATLIDKMTSWLKTNGLLTPGAAQDVFELFDPLLTTASFSNRSTTFSDVLPTKMRSTVSTVKDALCSHLVYGRRAISIAAKAGVIRASIARPGSGVPIGSEYSSVLGTVPAGQVTPVVDFGTQVWGQFQQGSTCGTSLQQFDSPVSASCSRVCMFGVQYLADAMSPTNATALPATLRSPASDIVLVSASTGQEVPITGLSTAVRLTFLMPTKQFNGAIKCRYWDSSSHAWSVSGVTTGNPYTLNGKQYLDCQTTHLSQFGLFESCPPGYTGLSCSAMCDTSQGFYGQDCASVNTCSSHGIPDAVTGACTCTVNGWTGAQCNTVCPSNKYGLRCTQNCDCRNGGTCSPANGACTCATGYTGTNCETMINHCTSNPCQNGATCVPVVNGYTCTCVAGYSGTHCQTVVNNCASVNCNFGTCINTINNFTCACIDGVIGRYCDSYCSQDMYGAGCTQKCVCQSTGDCDPRDGRCWCHDGYSGYDCGTPPFKLPKVLIGCLVGILFPGLLVIGYLAYRRWKKRQGASVASSNDCPPSGKAGPQISDSSTGEPVSEANDPLAFVKKAQDDNAARQEDGDHHTHPGVSTGEDLISALRQDLARRESTSQLASANVIRVSPQQSQVAWSNEGVIVAENAVSNATHDNPASSPAHQQDSAGLAAPVQQASRSGSATDVKKPVTQETLELVDVIPIEPVQDSRSAAVVNQPPEAISRSSPSPQPDDLSSSQEPVERQPSATRTAAQSADEQVLQPASEASMTSANAPSAQANVTPVVDVAPAATEASNNAPATKPKLQLPGRFTVYSRRTQSNENGDDLAELVGPIDLQGSNTLSDCRNELREKLADKLPLPHFYFLAPPPSNERVPVTQEATTYLQTYVDRGIHILVLAYENTVRIDLCTCGNVALFECSNCNKQGYCSTKCQREDWTSHKVPCKSFRRASKRTSKGSKSDLLADAAAATSALPLIPSGDQENTGSENSQPTVRAPDSPSSVLPMPVNHSETDEE